MAKYLETRGGRFGGWGVLLLAGALLAGCDGDGGGGGTRPPDPQPTLTLTAAPAALPLFGTSRLTARALSAAGTPVAASTEIRFSTTLGTLDAASVPTDADGFAATNLRVGAQAGTATVTAQLGTTSLSARAMVTVGGQGATVTVTATPPVIGLAGTSLITIRVVRNDGSGVPQGTRLEVTTTAGMLLDVSPRTDAFGIATTTLRATGQPGNALVQARLVDTGETGQVQVVIGAGQSVSLSATPDRLSPTGTSRIVVRVTNLDGSPAPGLTVNLATSLGRLDNASLVTSALGEASTMFRGDGRSGVAVLTATLAGSAIQATLQIPIGEGQTLTLSAAPVAIPTNGSSTLSATLRNFDGSPAGSGIAVAFTTNLGQLANTNPRTAANGVATTTLAGDGRAGVATVNASAAGAGSATVQVRIGEGVTLGLSANPPEIDSDETTLIRAVVLDTSGAPVANTTVTLSTTLGQLDDLRPVTNAAGAAVTTLRPQGQTGTAIVTARIAGLGVTTSITVEVSAPF